MTNSREGVSGAIEIPSGGDPFLDYRPDLAPRPFIDSVVGPGGHRVTRNFAGALPDGSDDHPHQKGIWWGHRDVNGADIWTEFEGHGAIVPVAAPEVAHADGTWTIRHRMRWVDREGVPLIDDERVLRIHPQLDDASRAIDVESVMAPVRDRVVLGDTKEAGLVAVRVAPELEERRGGRIQLATGAIGESESWGRAADWCDYSGTLHGQQLGVAVFDGPGNPRPAHWHVRDYGLMTANPFGLKDFTGNGAADGSLTIEPGQSTAFRYRVLVHAGDATSGRVAEHYRRYLDEVS
jgi:hypothetical protein